MEQTKTNRHKFTYQDNRDSAQMYDYLESRIDVLKRRLFELEMENATLRCQIQDSQNELVETYA